MLTKMRLQFSKWNEQRKLKKFMKQFFPSLKGRELTRFVRATYGIDRGWWEPDTSYRKRVLEHLDQQQARAKASWFHV